LGNPALVCMAEVHPSVFCRVCIPLYSAGIWSVSIFSNYIRH